MTSSVPLQKLSSDSYHVPLNPCIIGLDSISNLSSNVIYKVDFNDLSLHFYSDSNGTIYFNSEHDPLPIECLPNNTISLSPLYSSSKHPLKKVPSGNYGAHKLTCQPMTMTVDLVEKLPNTQTPPKFVTRTVQIKDGRLTLNSQRESFQSFSSASVGVL